MSPERWDVTRPWRSMRGVPSGWRMIARNWYSVLNASTARTFPRKSSRVRGCGVTMSERSTPIASRVRPRPDTDLAPRELEVPPGLLDEVHDPSRVPFREELFGHPRVEVHDAAGKWLLDDVLGDGFDGRDHGRMDPALLAHDPAGGPPLLQPRP